MTERWTAPRVLELSSGYRAACILGAAADLDLFAVVARGISRAEDVATELSSDLQAWVGRTLTEEEEIGLSSVRRAAAMLDLDPDAFRRGDPLPPHWFTLFFAHSARQSDLGPDGHPKPGVFLPPIPLPR